MLELRSLTKKFGKTVAVNNLSITCKEREFLVIFGPAGAGKSTTLRLIAGILQPDKGAIYFNNQPMKHVPPEKRNMTMVFENYALYSHLSVFENLAFPLRAKRFKEQEIRECVRNMAEILQITSLLDRRPGFLSGGQRQRVALGRTLIREADVYLLDEPISHLDAKLRHRMRGELKAIAAEKQATVIHVTHDYREAMALSDRVAVMNKGRLMQLGPPEEVFRHPANEFVARFVGDPPMSFIDVGYTEDNGDPFFHLYGGIRVPANLVVKAYVNDKGVPDSLRIGVRAMSLNVASSEDETHRVPAKTFVTETMGFRNILITQIGKSQVRTFVPPDITFKANENVWLNLHENNVHVFADSIAIAHPPGGN